MTEIDYRTPSIEDATALAALGRQSFIDAFGHLYADEDLNSFLNATYAVAALERELRNPRRIFRVAEEGGIMIGYCKLGLDYGFDHDIGARKAMELKQLYLMGARTGNGVGGVLTRWAVQEAKTRGYDAIALSVYSGNIDAQRFYQRHGFRHIADTYFMVGNHRDDEFLYALSLT
jgi:ribosomal protein S18 acetylase RimI-like enzyme